MDVDDAFGKRAEEFALENAHESGEHNEVDVRFGKGGDKSLLGFFVEFCPEFSWGDEKGTQAMTFGKMQNAGIFDVAGDERDCHWRFGASAIFGEGIEV